MWAWYLEAAPSALPAASLLSNPGSRLQSADLSRAVRDIGAGKRNTDIWYNLVDNAGQRLGSPAAIAVRTFDSGGWFVPSKFEIEHLISISPSDHAIRLETWATSSFLGGENAYSIGVGGGSAELWLGNIYTKIWPVRSW